MAGHPALLIANRPEAPPAVQWRAAASTDHVVMFYDDEDFLLDAVVGFIGTPLRAGQLGILVATPEHRASVEARLMALGVDVTAARAAGLYLTLDAREALARFMVDGRPAAEPFEMLLDGLLDGRCDDQPAKIFGEMVALLAGDGQFQAALELEELWNLSQQTRRFSLLCGYPMAHFAGTHRTDELSDACLAHSSVVPCESYSALHDRRDQLREIAILQQKAASLESALVAEREARQAAEAALHVRDEFLSTASHELRTPITVVGAQAQVALRRHERTGALAPEHSVKAFQTIVRQTEKIGRLVSQLLDVSRLDSGVLVMRPEPTDVAALLRDVVAVCGGLSELHPISLSAPDEVLVQVDPLRIEQVLMNLIDNAIKYCPDGCQIDVLLERVANQVEIAVRDHGPGIAADKREHIFDRFFQAEPDSSRGLGLGLYLCRKIVELHGGTMDAEAATGGGTRFRVRLPG